MGEPRRIISVYADGGVVGINPSRIGGTWAFRAVYETDLPRYYNASPPFEFEQFEIGGVDANCSVAIEQSGFLASRPDKLVTNNITEYVAAVKGLRAMPEGWSGKFYSDSQITIGRLFKGWKNKNLSDEMVEWGLAAVKRLGKVEAILLAGHPTKKDLAQGYKEKGSGLYPVSIHNVACDLMCASQAKKYVESVSL